MFEVGFYENKNMNSKNIKFIRELRPVIARMEACVHSPQLDSLSKLLASLGYTLQVVPIRKQR